MTSVRPQDLSFMAGGAVAQRHGVFVRRTSPTEDVAEVFARSTTAPRFDENGVVRNAAIDVPRLSWRDFDGDGVYEQAVLPIAPQTTNLIEFNVPGGVPSDFELSPMGVTNQTDEYYVEFDAGDDLQINAPANFDEDDFTIVVWGRPSFPNTDGVEHTLFHAKPNSANQILLQKRTNDSLRLFHEGSNDSNSVALTLPFSAGDEIFVAVRLNGGVLTMYADTNGDDTLETDTDTVTAYNTSFSGTPFYIAQNSGLGFDWVGGLNIAILNDGSSADPITERFGAGDGLDIQEWLETYGEQLVLYLPKSKDGEEVEKITYAGASQLLAEGNVYQLDLPGAGGDYAFCPDHPAFDVTDLQSIVCAMLDDWTPGDTNRVIAKWTSADNGESFSLNVQADGTLRYLWTEDGSTNQNATSSVAVTVSDGEPLWIKIEHDVDDEAADSTIKFSTSDDPITTAPADVSWTQLGTTQMVGATTSIHAGTAILEFGSSQVGTANNLAGAIYVAQVYDGIGGTLVLDADFRYLDGGETVVLSQDIYAHPITKQGNASFADSGEDISSGKFERYVKSGQKWFDGVDDEIDLGEWKGLDGVDGFAMFGVFTPEESGRVQSLQSRLDAADAARQFDIKIRADDKLQVELATNLAGGTSQAWGDTVLSVGTTYAVYLWYDGTAVADADRLKMAFATYDPATGTWGAFSFETLTFSASPPSALSTPTVASVAYFGRRATGGVFFKGFLDDWRIWLGSANRPATSELDELLVYDEVTGTPSTCFEPDHWWTFRGDADDERAHDGTLVRNDTGTYVSEPGVVEAVAANILRNRHFVHGGLNLITDDDLRNWTAIGTPVVTPNVSDPYGGTEAYTVEDDDGAGSERIYDEPNFTDDGVKVLVAVIRENTTPAHGHVIKVWDNGASAWRMDAEITGWVAGEPTVNMGTGVELSRRELGNGYWALYLQTTSVTAANDHRVYIDATDAAYVTEVGKIDVYRVNAYDSSTPSSPQIVNAGMQQREMMTLLEAGYTNLMTEADLDAWGKQGSPIVTEIPGPDGNATSAFTVEDDSGVATEYIWESVNFTGDAVKSFKIAVKENTMPGAGVQTLRVYDSTAFADRLVLDITSWAAGDPQITETTGTLLNKWQIGSTGWWVLECQTTAITGANGHNLYVYPADTGNQQGKIDVFFPGAFDAGFPPRSFLDASEVTTDDEFQKPISGWTPDQGYTIYGKIVNFTVDTGFPRVFSVGDAWSAGSALEVLVWQDINAWMLLTRTVEGEKLSSIIGGANAPTVGDLFEFRISVPTSGDVTWGVSKNGGAEATNAHAPGTWDAAFNSLFFSLGMDGAGNNQGNTGHIEWKAESTAGVSMADMRTLVQPDLFYWHTGMGLADVDGAVTGCLDWYDGRQPEGWTLDNTISVDRATGANQVAEGTYGVRVAGDSNFALYQTTASIALGKWAFLGTSGRETAGTCRLRGFAGAFIGGPAQVDLPTQGTLAAVAVVDQARATDTTTLQCRMDAADSEAYYDNVRAFEFAEPAWDTATKGDAIPGIDGLGGPWGIADASSVVASSEGIPLPYDIDFGTTIMKLESGPAGSGTRRYLFGLPGSMNDFTPDTLAGMVIGVYIPSSSEITPAQVTTHAVDDQGSSAGDVATATDRWQWLWLTHTWDAGATEAYFELRFADGVSLSGADEVLYMAIPTGTNGTIPLVPIPQIAEGTSVVEEEDFYTAFEIPPGAAGFYVELIAWAPGGLLYIGAAGNTGARLMLEYATDGTLLIFFSDGSSTSQKASVSTVSPGSNIKVLGAVTAAGALQIAISIDDAAEEQSTVAAALELPGDWGAQRVYLGSKGGGDHATVEILEAKAVRDSTYSLAEVGAVT